METGIYHQPFHAPVAQDFTAFAEQFEDVADRFRFHRTGLQPPADEPLRASHGSHTAGPTRVRHLSAVWVLQHYRSSRNIRKGHCFNITSASPDTLTLLCALFSRGVDFGSLLIHAFWHRTYCSDPDVRHTQEPQ
jgi:hypothetical protein